MNKIYIIRHGKTDWNDKGLLQGMTDITLNKEGVKQAEDLKEQIDLSKIDICFCSPLKRAKQTAQILLDDKIKIIYDSMVAERSFGEYEGKLVEPELIERFWNSKLNDKSSNLESMHECLDRAKKFLDKIKKEYPNKTILIISHGSFIKTLHFNLIGYDENTDFLSFKAQNAHIYEYTMK